MSSMNPIKRADGQNRPTGAFRRGWKFRCVVMHSHCAKLGAEFRGERTIFAFDFTSKPHQCPHKAIAQVIGPVVDIRFPEGAALPKILDALVVQREGGKLILETQKHIGEDTVRAIAMEATEGLSRGMAVEATGTGITMPTGEGIKGGLFNLSLIHI